MNPSRNLFIVGPTGAGKTSIGRRLAEHYGLPFVDLDHAIEQHTGASVSVVFEIEGEAAFRQRESALLVQFSDQDGVLLVTGAGAVLDPENRRRLAERGYVVWLRTTVEQQLERLARDARRPLLAGLDLPARRAKLEAMMTTRTPLYHALADLAVPLGHENIAAASERCVALIDRHWQRLQPSNRAESAA